MEAIITVICEQVAIWAPSLVAILGMVATILAGLNKVKEAIETFKSDRTLKDLETKLNKTLNENQEIVRTNKLLLEEITRIKDYADLKKKEK